MAGKLEGKRVAFLATDGVEQVELTEPWKAVEEEGGTPELVSVKDGEIQGVEPPGQGRHLRRGHAGGRRRRERLRRARAARRRGQPRLPPHRRGRGDASSRAFFEAGKPVAAICHGPWTLVEADVVRGRTLTSWPSLRTDIRNAGGNWVDEEVHVDSGFVTSRKPDDLPAFCEKLVEEICEGRHEEQALQTAGAGNS